MFGYDISPSNWSAIVGLNKRTFGSLHLGSPRPATRLEHFRVQD
jgi:hypothetical protein